MHDFRAFKLLTFLGGLLEANLINEQIGRPKSIY
jgi:hypothetical protein